MAIERFSMAPRLSTPLYVDEVVQESELVVRQAGASRGMTLSFQ